MEINFLLTVKHPIHFSYSLNHEVTWRELIEINHRVIKI